MCCILAGSCKDTGKTYALYSINVYRASSEGTKSWTVFRRYSDFDDLHMHLKEKVAINLVIVSPHCFYAVCRYWSRFLIGRTLFHSFLFGSLWWLLRSIYLRLSRNLSQSSLLSFLWNERGILGTRSFTYVILGPLTALPVVLNRFNRYLDWLKELIKQLTKTQMWHTTTRPASEKMVDPSKTWPLFSPWSSASTMVRAISFFI